MSEEEIEEPLSPMIDSSVVELKRLELQDRECEREAQVKLRELELREKELSLQFKLKELEKSPAVPTSSLSGSAVPFDVSKQIRFVPPFQEKEVDKYFLHFEKVATSLMWLKEVWMVLLQSVLVGKAREVYSAMTVEQSAQYDVKQAVLKAYELVPEAYRQNFRNRRIQDKQTYTFARDKEALFDRWCASKEVVKDFEKLRQLILVKEFKSCFYLKSGVLMRKWRPRDAPADEEWQVNHQIVVPRKYRQEILSLAHESPMAGHLGVNKTYFRILTHFYWLHLRKDVSEFCKCCDICQRVGKPNQTIPVAPLKPIPVCNEPFSQVIIDCVGPLPKTSSGNQYLLTIMCRFTHFPEAIPLRNIKVPRIADALVKFFTLVGLPSLIQSDQPSI